MARLRGSIGIFKIFVVLFLAVLETTAYGELGSRGRGGEERQPQRRRQLQHRNAYAAMMYMGTPRDYEFYVATRVMIRSLVKLHVDADLVVIASPDVPLRWVQALFPFPLSHHYQFTTWDVMIAHPQTHPRPWGPTSYKSHRNVQGIAPDDNACELVLIGAYDMKDKKEQEDGAKVVRVENLNNPYKDQNNFDKRFKLTLNKLYAWSLVQYDRVVMLDSDNLFLQNTDELFQCGQFCAAFINPCIFHTGLFVLQPSMEVFKDMLHQLDMGKDNPDGADQGFIGGYFPDLLSQPLFHPPSNGSKLNGTYRLPLGYQMDASYYYLRLHWSVPCGPNSVITFPGAPWLKPWYWWAWPVLPLGISWHGQRHKTLGYGAEMPVFIIQSIIFLGIIAMTRLARPNISKLCYRRSDKGIIHTSLKLIAMLSILAAYTVPFLVIPHTIHPLLGWSLYFLSSFTLCFIAINAFSLPMLPVLVPWIGIFGVLLVMVFPWFPNGVVRALSVFVYAFCAAPFLWVSMVKVMSSLQASLEREAYFPKIG